MTNIFVNGCFDLLHPGHIALLKYAKSLGDQLIVAIDSDHRVEEHKPGRPITPQQERLEILKAIRYVDKVFIFNSDIELRNLVMANKIDIMVVGSDWFGKNVIGSYFAKEVRYFERDERYSTTKTIEIISSRRILY